MHARYLVQYEPSSQEGSVMSDTEGEEDDDDEEAKWRLAWGWGGLPKIVRYLLVTNCDNGSF